jgi:hypothetical protein
VVFIAIVLLISCAKIRVLSDICKFSSSESREKLVFALLSREKIRPRGKYLA